MINPYNYYPASFNPYQMPYQQNQQQIQQNQQQQQNNSGGFIRVPNEAAARNYDVLPGQSLMFIDEAEPYFYTKTAGSSALEASIFKKYRLVEETDVQKDNSGIDLSGYALKEDLTAVSAAFDGLKTEVEKLRLYADKLKAEIKKQRNNLNLEYEGIDDL